ncbi:MAG: metallo-mystery pair system four-Cys motif protein, partial [Gemmatimonadetes bacterium]|nr:metallo-mystery pair system four-Cys motif protein [Gemmatimonadota bacterium]
YKFLRIDLTQASGPDWNVHLGSTGCTPEGDPTVPATSCSNSHRPEIVLTLDHDTDTIAVDYGSLLADSDLSQNQGGAPGCMSFPGDPDCPEVMNNLGLDYEGAVSGGQVLFGVN